MRPDLHGTVPGRSAPAWGRNPRRVATDPLHERENTLQKAQVRGRSTYEALCRKRALPVWGGCEHGVGASDRNQ